MRINSFKKCVHSWPRTCFHQNFLDNFREMCEHLCEKGLIFYRMALNKNKALLNHEVTTGLYVSNRNWPNNDSNAISFSKRCFSSPNMQVL